MAKARTRTVTRYVKAKRARRSSGFKLPVAVVAGFAPLAAIVIRGFQTGGIDYGLRELSTYTTGYIPQENRWSFAHLAKGMAPVVAGLLIHKYIGGKMGINAALGRAGVPLVRL